MARIDPGSAGGRGGPGEREPRRGRHGHAPRSSAKTTHPKVLDTARRRELPGGRAPPALPRYSSTDLRRNAFEKKAPGGEVNTGGNRNPELAGPSHARPKRSGGARSRAKHSSLLGRAPDGSYIAEYHGERLLLNDFLHGRGGPKDEGHQSKYRLPTRRYAGY